MRYILCVFCLLITIEAQAQPTADSLETLFSSSRRSVPLAFGLSAIVPGAGQAYNRNWLKAAAAITTEATVLMLYSSWRKKGMDGRNRYREQAHRHWSPVRYAYWLNDYTTYLNQLPDGRSLTVSPVEISPSLLEINLQDPGAWSQTEKLAVRALIQEIQRVESLVYHGDTGAAFSHVLPFFAEQQYYELIGKYFQYAPGWDDYISLLRDGRVTWIEDNGEFIASIEPEKSGPGGTKPNVSSRFYQYADDHADANTYLRRASRVTTILIANHFLTAIEAAIYARLKNRRMQVRLGLVEDVQGQIQVAPQVRVFLSSRTGSKNN